MASVRQPPDRRGQGGEIKIKSKIKSKSKSKKSERRGISMRLSPHIIIASVAAASALALGLLFRHIDGPRVVARAITPDGVEMCIIQRCNWSGEPFTTSFIYRKPGADWGWFYYDHQDSYWGRGRVSLDMKARLAVFYRDNSPAVTFAWDTETYTLHRWNRTVTGRQGQMPTR